ncbi:MAG: prenyltransferase/squalene oxidase repeat-containing protein, partial [Thermoplasmata archaeon]
MEKGMGANLEDAVGFVQREGGEIERARLETILHGHKPAENVVEAITGMQNDDGGFPYNREEGKPSTISDTEGVLVWLSDLGLMASGVGRRAIGYLLSMQKEDGSWDENPEITEYDPPVWMTPGDERVAVFNTCYSGFWLGVAGYRKDASFKKAYNFLIEHQDEWGRFSGFLHSSWIGTSVFAMAEGWESERVRRGVEFLDGIAPSVWVASQISWLLWCFAVASVPKDTPFVEKMLDELSKRQRDDGSFASEDGDPFALDTTIEAIK